MDNIRVILSAAVSLDGYLDDLSPVRLRLSSDEDWKQVQKLRAECDAILVGAGTVRKDNPSLVIRDENARDARALAGMARDIIKVTVSRSGRLDPESRFFTEGAGRKIVFSATPVDPALARVAEIIESKEITARFICERLRESGCRSLMVEGGSQILTMFLAEGVVDEFRLAIAPFFVGEEEAPRLVSAGPFPWVKDNRMTPYKVELLGDTTVMHLIPEAMNDDMVYMMMALEASRKCVPCATAYCVGAVVATAAGQFFTGYTHETGPANHAEEEAVAKALAAGADLHDAVMYSTMEPCSTRSSKLRSCTQMIIEYGFRRVVYAFKEPPCFVECHGDRLLREAGIVVDVMDSLAPEVAKINSHIIQ